MASNSKIEWTDQTWNPVVGCDKVSPGCAHCYAETMAARLKAMALADIAAGKDPGRKRHYIDAIDDKGRWSGKLIPVPESLADPLGWRKPRMCFVNSMSDLFHADVPDEFIDQVFAVMAIANQHTFQVLTKRSERMADYFHDKGWPRRAYVNDQARMILDDAEAHLNNWPLSNVWLGVSVEDRQRRDRIDQLRRCPAAVRFLSCEPLLEDLGELDLSGVSWVIVGGESGHGARPMHPQWARSIRDQCQAAGVAFFFKQWGEWLPETQVNGRGDLWPGSMKTRTINDVRFWHVGKHAAGRLLDGREWSEFPQPGRAEGGGVRGVRV